MNDYFITFRSITYAQRGERVLQMSGYRCDMRRTPRWMEEKGCGYCIHLRSDSPRQPVELLRKNGLPYRRVYVHQKDGRYEEITL